MADGAEGERAPLAADFSISHVIRQTVTVWH